MRSKVNWTALRPNSSETIRAHSSGSGQRLTAKQVLIPRVKSVISLPALAARRTGNPALPPRISDSGRTEKGKGRRIRGEGGLVGDDGIARQPSIDGRP